MPRKTAQDKQAYRTEVIRRINAAMPSVMQEYASINWAEELKGYRTDHEYYPDYIHAPIHGVTDGYTNPQSCLAWDAAMDVIIPLSHNVSCLSLREKMAELIPQDTQIDTVLELGAGTAEGALALARRFPQATFRITDVSPYMLAIAQHKFNKAGFGERAKFEQVDARHTGYPDNSFDLVTSSLLFHETPKEWTPKILKEMYRITKPGGWVLYADTFRGEYALSAYIEEPWLDDFIHFNFEYEFAKAGFTELSYIPYAAGLWYMVGRKLET
ncbi:class I SAM-dependent methyltransferase [Hassallia byssoidea VB512170]|uniref:Class I SAM-dependent methyltransferase n=1 Tax=Hassallia byssoidea VB512170 TaxID=1304833 RepID=A0A846HEQ0_9CYAN|nr:class I SAM-dependent methyltransferase [Hassalia byssoidea]NEU74921.1 class I SAM-dependent methyltransferase [Hassalia byssoidea VB512170]